MKDLMQIFNLEFFIAIFAVLYILLCPLVGLKAIEAETGRNYANRGEFFKRSMKNWFLTPIMDLIIIYKYSKLLESDIVLKSRKYAIACHEKRNCTYDGKPYYIHTKGVVDVIEEFIHLVPEKDRDNVRAGGWTHDVIEDTGETYNDVKNATNEPVAEYTYALSNEKGRNRRERANSKYYQGIRDYEHSELIKKADRIFNIRYAIKNNSRMKDAYKKEMGHFLKELNNPAYQEMTDCLIKLAEQC